jgi:hypothetical protein
VMDMAIKGRHEKRCWCARAACRWRPRRCTW